MGEKLLEVTNSKEQDFSEVIQTYKSHIEQLKSGVEDEIKRMTEQVVKSNLEDSQKLSNEQTILIDNMNSKYTEMLKEAEAIQLDKSTKSDKKHHELLKEIEILKLEIATLVEHQKTINETLSGCCKNQTIIEITVEKHINDFLKSIMENNTKTEAAGWINSMFVAKSELKKMAQAEADQTAQHIMDSVSDSIRSEFVERQ